MNKRGSMEVVIFIIVAVIALIGLVMLFNGPTGKATGQPQTRQVVPTEEEFRIERSGGYNCECSGLCRLDRRTESALTPVTKEQTDAIANCKRTLENRCAPQDLIDFTHKCATR